MQLRRDLPVPPPGRTEADGWIHARRLRFRSLLEDRGRYAWCPSTLGEIFLGQAGGTTLRNYAAAIGEVYAVRRAGISLEHAPRRWFMRAGDYVLVRGGEPVRSALAVSCGIPGHDHPGDELKTEVQRVDDGALTWEVYGRCGFAADFDYQSDQ